jgi:hypothetical protein
VLIDKATAGRKNIALRISLSRYILEDINGGNEIGLVVTPVKATGIVQVGAYGDFNLLLRNARASLYVARN